MIIVDDDGIMHKVVPMSVLDDIRAEIETLKLDTMYRYVGDFRYGVDTVVAIIDKHMKEDIKRADNEPQETKQPEISSYYGLRSYIGQERRE